MARLISKNESSESRDCDRLKQSFTVLDWDIVFRNAPVSCSVALRAAMAATMVGSAPITAKPLFQ